MLFYQALLDTTTIN